MKKIRILALVLALLLTASLAACAAKSSAPMAYDNTASAADNYKTEAASENLAADSVVRKRQFPCFVKRISISG